jgi:hypothetical protein
MSTPVEETPTEPLHAALRRAAVQFIEALDAGDFAHTGIQLVELQEDGSWLTYLKPL